jgi:hypothetical protein
VQVFGGYWLVIGGIGAKENDQVGSVPVSVAASAGGHAEGVLHCAGARGVTKPRGVIHVIRSKKPRDLLRHVIDLICDATRSNEEGKPSGIHFPNPAGDAGVSLVPGDAAKTFCAAFAKQRAGEPAQLAELGVVETIITFTQPDAVHGAARLLHCGVRATEGAPEFINIFEQ